MKNYLKALVALALLTGGAQLQAWTYGFVNLTNKKIAVKLVYQGWFENPRVRVLQPAGTNVLEGRAEFTPGDLDITKGKAGFVPEQNRFGYIVNPPAQIVSTAIADNKTRDAQIAASKNYGWIPFEIKWVKGEKYKLFKELSKTLAEASEKAIKIGMKAGAAYMTGGASAAAEGATEAAKTALDNAKKTSNALEKVADAEFGLATLFSSIGKVAARDLVGNHEISIIEVPNDKGDLEIKFICSLG